MSGTPTPAEVVVVGNAGVDTSVYPYGDEIDWSVEANFTETLDTVGQAGGYASRGYARLGRRVAFIGHVGADHDGDLVRAWNEREAVLNNQFVLHYQAQVVGDWARPERMTS